jgi:hypothetical protein
MTTRSLRESGSVRIALLLLGLIAGALWEGGQNVYTALKDRQPTVLGYDAYVQAKPNAAWLTLTNCVLDLTESCYKSYNGGKPTELFIPVNGVERRKDQQIHVLLATSDPAQLQAFAEMQALDSKTADSWLAKNSKRVFGPKNVSGLVRFGIKLDDRERSRLGKLLDNAANDFIIIEDGTSPSLASGLCYSVTGLMLLGLFVAYIRRNREPAAAQVY